jgi:hypothetical protein
MDDENNNPEGIGGWLILVAIGLIISPVKLGFLLVDTYPTVFSSGLWEALTTPGSEHHDPLLASMLMGEIVANVGMLLVSLYIIYLFFSRKKCFPAWYIGNAIFYLIYVFADAYTLGLMVDGEQVAARDTVKVLVLVTVSVVIWVSYMLVSVRVKATFTR